MTAQRSIRQPSDPVGPGGLGDAYEPYAIDTAAVAKMLDVDPAAGLNQVQVAAYSRRYGPNNIQTVRKTAAWQILLNQFKSIIVALLAFAALLAWFTGDIVEGVAIVVVLILNAAIG